MNCIIDKDAKRIGCNGAGHDTVIQQRYHCSILKFMKAGGIRVKVHSEAMAIEYRQPMTSEQVSAINSVLRDEQIFCIVTDSGLEYSRIEKFRPIRKLCLTTV